MVCPPYQATRRYGAIKAIVDDKIQGLREIAWAVLSGRGTGIMRDCSLLSP
jgi:hypothetical protein